MAAVGNFFCNLFAIYIIISSEMNHFYKLLAATAEKTTSSGNSHFGLMNAIRDGNVDPLAEMQFCHQLVEQCPYLQHHQVRPNEDRGRVAIDAILSVSRLIGIDELHHQFSLQVQLDFQWRLPTCARWGNSTNGTLPSVPYCEFSTQLGQTSIWKPPIIHTNEMGINKAIERYFQHNHKYSKSHPTLP